MKPVYQKVIEQGKGDCWRACIASILELDIDEVPNFVGDSDHTKGITADTLCRDWLKERGLYIVELLLWNDKPWDLSINFWYIGGAYCIASVPSQRFKHGTHAVVGQFVTIKGSTEFKIVHDPNKGNSPYPDDVKITRMQFICNFCPKVVNKIS